MLAFRPLEVLGSIHPQQGGDRVIRRAIEQQHAPAQGLCRDASAADRVPRVMLAIAKSALSVLPGLPPVHRGKADQKGLGRKSPHERNKALFRPLRPQLQRMLLGPVVIEPRGWREALECVDQQISFGGMQVSARRVRSKRPADLAGLLPRRNGERIFEKARKGENGDRSACDCSRAIQVFVGRRGRRVAGFQARQGNERGALVASKRIRLIRPIHVAERARIAEKMMFRLLVVLHDRLQRIERLCSAGTIFRHRIHSSPHSGLPSSAPNEENIRFKLRLTRVSALALASTEWYRYEGKTSSVPFLTFTTT